MTDLRKAVDAHVTMFNESVRRGDWSAFTATFAEDAVLRFLNVPVGPFHGRAAIAEAYDRQPPDDTMTITSVEETRPQTAQVEFAWDQGGSGTMTVVWQDGQVAEQTITFE